MPEMPAPMIITSKSFSGSGTPIFVFSCKADPSEGVREIYVWYEARDTRIHRGSGLWGIDTLILDGSLQGLQRQNGETVFERSTRRKDFRAGDSQRYMIAGRRGSAARAGQKSAGGDRSIRRISNII